MSDESAATLGPDGATVPAATSSPRASAFVEPPLSDEMPEMYQKASECDDPTVYRLLDVIVANRRRQAKRASAIVRMLDDGAA